MISSRIGTSFTLFLALCGGFAGAQTSSTNPAKPTAPPPETKVALENDEALFSTLAAINACGYDAEIATSNPMRQQVRNEIVSAVAGSSEATAARDAVCRFYEEHQQPDSARELSQYISFALSLNGTSPFAFAIAEASLPPDALLLRDFLPLLQRFHDAAGLNAIWQAHQPEYDFQIGRYHDPVRELIFQTDLYLKLAQSNYLGRGFVVYVEPMGAPSQINARNYGDDYFLVISPVGTSARADATQPGAAERVRQARHTYLHYVLDPLMLKRANLFKRLDPLMESVQKAPLENSFKHDTTLLVQESLIRAIEARTLPANNPDKKAVEAERSRLAQASMEEGFVLTRYFYDFLTGFERDPIGIRDAFPDALRQIDVQKEQKRIAGITFSSKPSTEFVRAARPKPLLDLAEERLSQNDPTAAHKLAQQVLDEKTPGEDPARAMFVLARAATLERDIPGAKLMFERTLELSKEPKTVAWSHIYLGRIFDRECHRDIAMTHYRAALQADTAPETKNAANRGLTAPPEVCKDEE